jgi:hypothetical protein
LQSLQAGARQSSRRLLGSVVAAGLSLDDGVNSYSAVIGTRAVTVFNVGAETSATETILGAPGSLVGRGMPAWVANLGQPDRRMSYIDVT